MISNNNPLLSEIIDVMNLHPDLIEQLQLFNLWDEKKKDVMESL
nr:8039_t:CDS:2 [Entrophospora candida]